MVQFKVTYTPLGDDEIPSLANAYWKLGRPRKFRTSTKALKQSLNQVGFYFRSSANKERLFALLFRYKRGLLSYEAYTVAELKAFIEDRRLTIPGNAKKDVIVRELEADDERATFTKFLGLPPELRNRIYTVHFESFPNLDLPTTPPITQVSRQLRQETLTLFYHTCKLIINIHRETFDDEPPRCIRRLIRDRLFKEQPSRATSRLFSIFPSQHLGSIRKFQLRGMIGTPTRWIEVSWEVDLGGGRSGVRITAVVPKPRFQNYLDIFRPAREKYEPRIRQTLEAIVTREGSEKLRRDDLQLLRRMFEAIDGE